MQLALIRHSIIILISCLALAQQPTDEQFNKLYSQMDDALGLHPGATVGDIGPALRLTTRFE